MATAPTNDPTVDQFLGENGHDVREWEDDGRKKRCPECGAVHDAGASDCSVCDWFPGAGR